MLRSTMLASVVQHLDYICLLNYSLRTLLITLVTNIPDLSWLAMLGEVSTDAKSVAGMRCVAPVGDLNSTYITIWGLWLYK